MKRRIILIVFFSITLNFIVNIPFAENRISHRFVDKTVAGILVGGDYEEKVMKYYGKGTLVQEGFAWCYYSTDQNQYIIFELCEDKIICSIALTKNYPTECQKIAAPKKPFKTSKGIQLRDTPEKVIKIYGEPEKKEIKDGMLVFHYHTNYREDPQVRLFYDAHLYFKDGKLVKLHIHDGS
jgi:hypothetical protein